MSQVELINKRLIEEDRLVDLLEAIDCTHIKAEQINNEKGELITARLPSRFNSPNNRAVQIRVNKYLNCSIRNRADFDNGSSIYSLISYIHFNKREEEIEENFYEAKSFICELFGWNFINNKKKGYFVKKDYVAPLKEIVKNKKNRVEIKSNPILPESVLDNFYYRGNPLPFKEWIEEGISYKTQRFYGVGFDLESKRIIFPLRNRFGKLVGVKGRIMKDEDDLERKYLYLYRCDNRYEWFNFYFAHKHILIHKKVYIFESEKSCMKAHSMGIYNTLAIGATDITPEQTEIIKSLGLDIQIILCYDKDKTTAEVKHQSKSLIQKREVFGMFDADNLLENYDSPIDKGIDIWNKLVENNIYEIRQKT